MENVAHTERKLAENDNFHGLVNFQFEITVQCASESYTLNWNRFYQWQIEIATIILF